MELPREELRFKDDVRLISRQFSSRLSVNALK
jgi:hypothetical protein